MKRHYKTILFALVAGLALSGGVSADVNAEFDPDFVLSAYSSYAWRDGTPARREKAEQHIRASVDAELAAAGLQLADDGAELWVVTHILVDKHALRDLNDQGYWDFYAGVKSVDAYDLAAGTLVVDLVDAELEKIVWRGVLSETIDKDMKSSSKKIDKAIHKLFKRLPQ